MELVRRGNEVTCGIDITYKQDTALPSGYNYATIPAGWRPSTHATFPALWAATTGNAIIITVTPTGGIQADSLGTSSRRLIAQCSWIVA